MESFWKWLLQANARRVLISSIVALVVVCAYWLWREFAPAPTDRLLEGGSPPAVGEREPLGLDRLFAVAEVSAPDNLFMPPGWRPPEPRTPPTRAVTPPPRTVRAVTPPRREPAKPEPPAAPVVPKTEVVTLIFKGIMQGTDGKTLAWIEDSKQKTTRFYRPGRKLHGMEIGEVNRTDMTIVPPGGEPTTVKLNEPKVFEIPRE